LKKSFVRLPTLSRVLHWYKGMITADQLLAHAIGDYILQSDWMATEKTKKSLAAVTHVIAYGLPFLLFRPSWLAMAVIVGTHFIIDRWRLARFVVTVKNHIAPWGVMRRCFGAENGCRFLTPTGYPAETPPFLSVWLLIIADNIMHVTINGLALMYL
jgi:hypothetical protein